MGRSTDDPEKLAGDLFDDRDILSQHNADGAVRIKVPERGVLVSEPESGDLHVYHDESEGRDGRIAHKYVIATPEWAADNEDFVEDLEREDDQTMTDQTNRSDARTVEQKTEMAEHFAENEADYRDADWSNVVYEDEQVVLIEDLKGYEFGEWSDEFDAEFSETMHDLADQLVDRRWSASYPLVFDKLEDNNYPPLDDIDSTFQELENVDNDPRFPHHVRRAFEATLTYGQWSVTKTYTVEDIEQTDNQRLSLYIEYAADGEEVQTVERTFNLTDDAEEVLTSMGTEEVESFCRSNHLGDPQVDINIAMEEQE